METAVCRVVTRLLLALLILSFSTELKILGTEPVTEDHHRTRVDALLHSTCLRGQEKLCLSSKRLVLKLGFCHFGAARVSSSPSISATQVGNITMEDPDVSTFTCEVCIEPVPLTMKFNNHKNSYHSFCVDCVAKHIQVKTEEYHMSEIKCPALNCDEILDPVLCRSLLPKRVFDRWCDVLCESAVSEYQRVHCPFTNCSTLILNECGDKIMKTRCPNCKKLFCFECKYPWHAGYRCAEAGQLNTNDVLLGLLMERKNWKRCPVCHHGVELRSGCSVILCRCGRTFCYTCGSRRCRCVRTHRCYFGWTITILVIIFFIFVLGMFMIPSVPSS